MRCHRTITTMLLLLRSTCFGFRASNTAVSRCSHQRRLILSQWQCRSTFSAKPPTVEISPSNHGTSPLTNFQSSALDQSLVHTLRSRMNITNPTPIQSAAIPLLLPEKGCDVMASSATGSGKTIMFGLPLLQKLLSGGNYAAAAATAGNSSVGRPSSLIIAPTRELAIQISSVLQTFTTTSSHHKHQSQIKVCHATGGSDTRQQRLALPNCNILVGTPGRIVQFIDERKLSLNNINYLVIDEADRLLDLGFEKELTRISRALRSNNNEKQSVLCSATFPEGVQRLAADFLDPKYYFVSVGVVGSTHSKIRQTFEWMDLPSKRYKHDPNGRNVDTKNARVSAVIRNVDQFWNSPEKKKDQSSVIVFSNTKDGVEEYGKALSKKFGGGKVRVIHGDKEQSQRNKAIDDFKSGRASLLVATDVAARGLDVTSIGLVVQADAPRNVDTYTHRIGRTGRAGASGNAVTFIDGKSMGIASGLVDLLTEAGQHELIPSWLWGMSHVSNARSLEEEMQIQAGSSSITNAVEGVVNEDFTEQDFRRTAAEGSYGVGKDTAYRAFDEEAYSDSSSIDDGPLVLYDNNTCTDVETETDLSSLGESNIHSDHDDATLFYRQEPSKQLTRAVSGLNGATIDDTPNKNILNSLRSNQQLKFEYIGLFPFDQISSLLKNTSDRSGSNNMTKILMVAEKPSIAKAIADSLSGNRPPRQLRGISRALPLYEFTTDKFQPINGHDSNQRSKCLVRVTSVVGHVYSLGFDFDQTDNKSNSNPRDYFSLKVAKKEESTTSKLRVVDHLKALAGDSSHLVLWLDCDAEGENIAHEVIAITRRAILSNASADDGESRRIHRAQFSAITPKAIQDAFSTLQEPDANLSRSVDARQELDLRIGVAITRLLTWKCVNIARRRFSPSTRMVSYGPCQTPALSFCVDRLREIEQFKSKAKKYYKVNMEVKLPNGQIQPVTWRVPPAYIVEDTRNTSNRSESSATFDHQSAKLVIQKAKEADMNMVVKSVTHSAETMNPPVGLNTVRLLEAGSKAMGMSPKNVMNVAEKLYSAGLISYPRTETTRYDPNGFDAKSMIRIHTANSEWGKSASYLLRTMKSGKPPKTGRDCGDHPPITPLKSVSKGEVGGGAAWRVYDFVCRNFIGSLHNDLEYTKTVVVLTIPGSDDEFELEMINVDSLGFADACRWVLRDIGATSGKTDNKSLNKGDSLAITKTNIEEKTQRPPKFLQEHELIREMDEKGIGTDASMAVHVSNIVDREYVKLVDETGTPLRPPLPPGKRKQNLPRQVGRYLVPTPLGASLMELFGHNAVLPEDESPALLSHPSIRKQMEQEVKQIARGEIDKESCVQNNLKWFEKRYSELEESLTRDRIYEFGEDLTVSNLKYLQSLDAFEPKVHISTKGKEAKQPNRRAHTSFTKSKRDSSSSPKKRQKRKVHKASAK